MMLLLAAFALLSFGCDKKPQKPQTEQPAETGAEQPEPAEPDAGDEETDAGESDTGEQEVSECPEAREYQGMCAQVITWVRNPDTGTCCQYGSPCEAPQDWQTFTSEADCVQAGGQTEQ